MTQIAHYFAPKKRKAACGAPRRKGSQPAYGATEKCLHCYDAYIKAELRRESRVCA